MIKRPGPGMLIAAAFIGPGTVTTCIRAGVTDGFSLLWALLLSIFATVVLQEMAGRLGLISRQGLASAVKQRLRIPLLKTLFVSIILIAIVLGNAAYEAGNIAGAVLGLEGLAGREGIDVFPWLIAILAFILLWNGNNKFLERVFTVLVLLMSVSFMITAVLTLPSAEELFKGLFIPNLNGDNIYMVMALIGTTVVPYNLFLYASLVTEKWSSQANMGTMRSDIGWSVILGGIVSMCILIAAAGAPITEVKGVMDLAAGLEPIYGSAARYGLGIGLLAAGITSAITAPLAAAYVANQCFGWHTDTKNWRFRIVWAGILLFGALSLSLDFKPLEIIYTAQIANAVLLPVIALFLWWILNSRTLMGKFTNSAWQNILAATVILLVIGLAGKSFLNHLNF
ncbi:Nramp family divalent metal transporter [Robiginitalea sp. IMCC43444]|uniref:Nramp family divalent metal transporter n=1 Tax=Robiginitalea sp. IMCC43444 TaxID=3459121 RepID=UPI0040411DD5